MSLFKNSLKKREFDPETYSRKGHGSKHGEIIQASLPWNAMAESHDIQDRHNSTLA